MGAFCHIYIESRPRPEVRLPTDKWTLDPQTSRVDDLGWAHGISVCRGMLLYRMLGYWDGPRLPRFGEDGYHEVGTSDLSPNVSESRYSLAGANSFWAIKPLQEIEIVHRCWVEVVRSQWVDEGPGAEGRPAEADEDDPSTWGVTLSPVVDRMHELEAEGNETRAVLWIE